MEEHAAAALAELAAPTEADVRNLLARLGDPETIAADAGESLGVKRSRGGPWPPWCWSWWGAGVVWPVAGGDIQRGVAGSGSLGRSCRSPETQDRNDLSEANLESALEEAEPGLQGQIRLEQALMEQAVARFMTMSGGDPSRRLSEADRYRQEGTRLLDQHPGTPAGGPGLTSPQSATT